MKPSNNQQAPGCFGASSCYAGDSKVCQSCQVYTDCGNEVWQTLERIATVTDVSDIKERHKKALLKARKDRSSESSDKAIKPSRKLPSSLERTTKLERVTYDIDEETQSLIATLPVKVQSFTVSLCKADLINQIKRDIKHSQNPLNKTGPKWLAVALQKLIDGGFKKSELKTLLISEMDWVEGTATSYVSLAVKLFAMFEIAIVSNGKMIANPALLSDNC